MILIKEAEKRQRTLIFTQITDDRFNDDIEDLLNERLAELERKLNLDGVYFKHYEPYEVDFGENKQFRADCVVRKTNPKITWNDIKGIINSVKAVPYKFV